MDNQGSKPPNLHMRRDSGQFPMTNASKFTMPEMAQHRVGARPFDEEFGQFSPPFTSRFNQFGFSEPELQKFNIPETTTTQHQPPAAGVRIPITVFGKDGTSQVINNTPIDRVKRSKFGSNGSIPTAGTTPPQQRRAAAAAAPEFGEFQQAAPSNITQGPNETIKINLQKTPQPVRKNAPQVPPVRKTSAPAKTNVEKVNADLDQVKRELQQEQQQQQDEVRSPQSANQSVSDSEPRSQLNSTESAEKPAATSLLHESVEPYQEDVLRLAIEFETLPCQNLDILTRKELQKLQKQVKTIAEFLIRILTKLDSILSDNQHPHLKISRRVVVKNANFWMDKADQMDERIQEAIVEKADTDQ